MIISYSQLSHHFKKQEIKNQRLVLVGGVFDLLHVGHIRFLEHAKKEGDLLAVLVESDTSVKKKKGENRPINTQEDRALLLDSLRMVDLVICLPDPTTDADYAYVTKFLKPAIIATTANDPTIDQKKTVAAIVGADVMEVVQLIEDTSTTHLARLLAQESL